MTGDFNGDNKLDLAATNEFSDDITVLLGNGNGTFQNQLRFGVGDSPTSLVAGYFDDDGRPERRLDLATADSGVGDISVLLGNGDGTFQTQVRFAVGIDSIPRTSLVTGDFNGDRLSDLAATDKSSGDITVLLSNGDGSFQTSVRISLGADPTSLVAGDFNGDGRPDLAAATSYGITVLLGNGDGTFPTPVPFGEGIYGDFLVAGDFNGDKKLDLAAAVAVPGDITVLLGNGDGTFKEPVQFTVEGGFRSLVMGDFDGDGRPDLAASDADSGGIALLLGNGNGTFKDPVRWSWVGALLDSLVTGDFDGDNKTDLAASDADSGGIALLLGNGNGTFQDPVRSGVGAFLYPDSLVTGDFDSDNKLDLAATVYSGAYSGGIAVLLGNGNGTFKDPVPFGAPIGAEGYPPLGTMQINAGPSSLVAGDLNGDGRSDLGAANFGSYDIAVLLGGVTQFAGAYLFPATATPLLADLNSDGANDVVVTNAAGDILYRRGQPRLPGSFQPPVKVNPGFPARYCLRDHQTRPHARQRRRPRR